MEKLTFRSDDGEAIEYFVLAETTVKGIQYLLVTEEEEGDSDAMILKGVASDENPEESVFEAVGDEDELAVAMEAFSKLLEDVEFE